MADGHHSQGGQQYNSNDYYLKQQAARMLSAIQKGYNDSFTSQGSMSNQQTSSHDTVYMNHQVSQQQQQVQQQVQQHPQQGQSPGPSQHMPVQHQQLQHQLQQVQQAQQQFQQMQHLAQMQQQFQQYSGSSSSSNSNVVLSQQAFNPSRRGRKPTDKKKRRRHTWVKRPTTAYLYFVSKYRETLKEAGEVVPKAKIITQACAEKWRNMNEDEKEPFLELSRRDRERWQKDKALEKKPRDPNRPKRPPSAYFLFLAEFRKSYPGKTDPAKEITKKAGEAWNSLSEEEKAPYYREAQVIRAKWERDLEIYKQNTSASSDKNGPLSRSTSMESDPGQLDLGSDTSPSTPSSREGLGGDLNVGIMQGSSGAGLIGMQSGHNMGGNGGSSQSSVLANSGATSRSGASYGYNLHPGAQAATMPFPGR